MAMKKAHQAASRKYQVTVPSAISRGILVGDDLLDRRKVDLQLVAALLDDAHILAALDDGDAFLRGDLRLLAHLVGPDRHLQARPPT